MTIRLQLLRAIYLTKDSIAVALAMALASCCAPLAFGAPVADASPVLVELRCKIIPAPKERGYKLWKVELRKSNGEPSRKMIAATGDTVRFKKLEPGIYSLCLTGEHGRNQCLSVDLSPPPNEIVYRFTKEFPAPPTPVNQTDTHQVNASRLGIPDKAKKHMRLSEEAQTRGDSKQAVWHLEQALEIYPDYADVLNNLGTHHHRSGNYALSIEYFTKATQLDANFFAGWVNLGGSLLASGNFYGALEANRKALDLRPGDALANTQMAINQYYLRKFSEAKRYFQKVIVLDPYSANSPQLYLAHIALAERNHKEAEKNIRQFLDLHPHSPQAESLRQTLRNLSSSLSLGVNLSAPQR